jgi:hypothetical protein
MEKTAPVFVQPSEIREGNSTNLRADSRYHSAVAHGSVAHR